MYYSEFKNARKMGGADFSLPFLERLEADIVVSLSIYYYSFSLLTLVGKTWISLLLQYSTLFTTLLSFN